ncbi:MAG TPA: PIG-L family deacetylase [Silvibacterium sp.]|nr:PIG-L family deacetylase [Silvibacterium sp.]
MPLRLLCITAHPDDESGGFGGALLLANRDGIETSLLCLTDGQAAHYRGGVEDNAELGRRRRAELAAACSILGVTQHEVLQYPDGELMHENFYDLTGAIVARVRDLRPHIILTFGGDGSVNLHRDHTIVSVAATAAFHWAGRPEFFSEQDRPAYTPQKLYHASTPFVTVRNHPELSDSPTVPYSLTLELGELAKRKMNAFAQHSSQAGVLERVKDFAVKYLATERYLLVAARGQQTSVLDDSAIFSGVVDD